MRLTVSLIALVLLVWSRGSGSEGSLRTTHDALFNAFLPVNAEQVRGDAVVEQMFVSAREQMWTSGANAPAFQQLLTPFADLRRVGSACGLEEYLRIAGKTAFADLTSAQRRHVLYVLQSCSENKVRRLAMNARNYSIVKVYGMLQEPLTGVRLNVYAPAKYVAEHRPKLPPSRLRYDTERREIVLKDGPIDYLVVGSGPAGSVLAHELRRGGTRVLLVERGSFIVPGSMETRLIDDLVDTRRHSMVRYEYAMGTRLAEDRK
jgi:hypothetical protein